MKTTPVKPKRKVKILSKAEIKQEINKVNGCNGWDGFCNSAGDSCGHMKRVIRYG